MGRATSRPRAWRHGFEKEGRARAPSSQHQRGLVLLLQEFADSLSQLVTQKFRELTVGLTSSVHARHKALAGIVMTKGKVSCFPVGISSEEGSQYRPWEPKMPPPSIKEMQRKTKVGHRGVSDKVCDLTSKTIVLRAISAQASLSFHEDR